MTGYVARLTRPIDIVEAGYDLEGSLERWLHRILRAAAGDLEAGMGVYSFVSRIEEDGLPVCSPVVSRGVSPEMLAAIRPVNAAPPPGIVDYVRRRVVSFASLSAAFGGPTGTTVKQMRKRVRIGDSIAAMAQDGEGSVLQLIATSAKAAPIHPRTRDAWRRVLLHLGTGLRLRLRLEALVEPRRGNGDTTISAEDVLSPAAVLTPGGRVAHASGDAKSADARAALVAAVKDVERARTAKVRRNAEEALALWRGLVSGRWSLVDRFESDGRRYLAAHENRRSCTDPRALSTMERDCLDYYVRGASTAEIAFAFGRSPATVGTTLSSIARRLGFPTRAALREVVEGELTRLTVELGGRDELAVLVIDDAPVHDAWHAVLSVAELEVAVLAARGLTDSEIATKRQRSVRTVSNQLRAVYGAAGVRTRGELAHRLSRPPRPSRGEL